MAFNWPVFRTRALSSIAFVAVMVAGFLWGYWSFLCLLTIIHFGCWIEYQRLVKQIDPAYASISFLHRYGVILTGWGFMLWMGEVGYGIPDIGFWMMVAGAFAVNVDTLLNRKWKLLAHSLMGLLYISLALGLLIDMFGIRNPSADLHIYDTYLVVDLGFFFVVATITSMWINDTMAYIVGSMIGKTPLSKISPKKTWEGTIGGVLLCIVVIGLVFSTLFIPSVSRELPSVATHHWYVIAGIAAVFGTLGDLFESKLKRLAGVKDSGRMMPGHGGFLDRFDSLLLAAPFVWLYIWLFV